MALRFNCTKCGGEVETLHLVPGEQEECCHCGERIEIPSSATEFEPSGSSLASWLRLCGVLTAAIGVLGTGYLTYKFEQLGGLFESKGGITQEEFVIVLAFAFYHAVISLTAFGVVKCLRAGATA